MSATHTEHRLTLPEGVSMRRSRSMRGFSLIELLVVVAVVLIIAAFAIPTLTTTMDSIRIRGALGSASNIVQRTRIQAIKRNVYQRLHINTVGSQVALFVTDGADANVSPAAVTAAGGNVWSQVWLSNEFSIPGAPTGTPPKLTTLQMWGSNGVNLFENQDPYFNSRGMPCQVVGNTCATTGGFVYYYQYQSAGHTRWAATSISPAGRIESWIWNGSSWGN